MRVRTVAAAGLILVIFMLSVIGAADGMPGWVRGALNGGVALIGLYLGSRLQAKEQGDRLAAIGDNAVEHLAATGRGLLNLIESADEVHHRLANQSSKSVAVVQAQATAALGGIGTHGRSLLLQVESAAAMWRDYSPRYAAIVNREAASLQPETTEDD